MSTILAAVMEPLGKGRIALESVDVQARLHGLLSHTEVTQTYRNVEAVSIEAVYTFPLPLGAVLLDLELTLNGRSLHGVVQAKAKAEARYEDAIDEGNSAVLLEAAGPGVYTLNIGNLMAGEKAVVRLRYAQLHHWQGDSLRFQLPTTIAPRYGDPTAAGLAPHQVPEYALTSSRGFSLSVVLEGELANADFECPTHTVMLESVGESRCLRLSGGSAIMDRDFVLVLREPKEAQVEGLWTRTEEGFVALASFHPLLPQDLEAPARCVTLVVDCSGSMGGDSIDQARSALHDILALLKPMDRFNLIAFGSSYRVLFAEPVDANREHLREANRFIARLDADMGGTEIGAALQAAYRSGPTDILLITDGEVWQHSGVVDAARRAGQRVFTVGVGSAVSEAFVRDLAEVSGGACELVSPNEQMSERIVRHFGRMDQPRAQQVRVEWPVAALSQAPQQVRGVYAGDTVHVFAWLSKPPRAPATLVLGLDDGREVRSELIFSTQDTGETFTGLERVAAYTRLRDLGKEEATALAVQQQLVTKYTSCVLVHQRQEGEKAGTLPALRKVPQVLAAGWGGTGAVPAAASVSTSCDFDAFALEDSVLQSRGPARSAPAAPSVEASIGEGFFDIPAFLRRETDEPVEPGSSPKRATIPDVGLLVSALNKRFPAAGAAGLDGIGLDELARLGFGDAVITASRDWVDGETTERDVVLALLSALAQATAGEGLSRHVKRLIRKESKDAGIGLGLVMKVIALISQLKLA